MGKVLRSIQAAVTGKGALVSTVLCQQIAPSEWLTAVEAGTLRQSWVNVDLNTTTPELLPRSPVLCSSSPSICKAGVGGTPRFLGLGSCFLASDEMDQGTDAIGPAAA